MHNLLDFSKDELNLDDMSKEQLILFYQYAEFHQRSFSNHLGVSVDALKNLKRYAINKSTAMSCRLDGSIKEAMEYEEICDKIYSKLPDELRW